MAITFENEKILFDDKYGTAKEIDCFLPVHLTIGGKENDLYKKDGSHNEQYYKCSFYIVLFLPVFVLKILLV